MDIFSQLQLLIPSPTDPEIQYYYTSATKFLQSQTPYTDFIWEYPPAVLYFYSLIKLLTPNILFFIYTNFLIILISLLYLIFTIYKFGLNIKPKNRPLFQIIVIITSIFLTLIVNKSFINLDIIPAAIIATALIKYANKSSTQYSTAFLLGIATAFRLYPIIIFLPIFLTSSHKLKQICYFTLPIILSLIPLLHIQNVISFLHHSLIYQLSRPIEIGSLAAGLISLTKFFGQQLTTLVDPDHHVLYINFSPTPPNWWFIIQALIWTPLIITLWQTLKLYKIKETKPFKIFYLYSLINLLIIALILRNPVFSSQYLIWLWTPFFLYLFQSIHTKKINTNLIFIFSTFILLHLANFWYLQLYTLPYIEYLINLAPITIFIINLKNALLIILWLQIFITLQTSTIKKIS